MNHTQLSTETGPDSASFARGTDPQRGRGTILLVEDESFLREVTCEILESAGYRVLKTRNAAEATSTFGEYKSIVRLLLTDVVLPGQNGRDLAHDLRSVCPKLKIHFHLRLSGKCGHATRNPGRRNVLPVETVFAAVPYPKGNAGSRARGDSRRNGLNRLVIPERLQESAA